MGWKCWTPLRRERTPGSPCPAAQHWGWSCCLQLHPYTGLGGSAGAALWLEVERSKEKDWVKSVILFTWAHRWGKSKFTFHGCQLYDTMGFPEGLHVLSRSVVVFLGLGIEMHLYLLRPPLLVHDFDCEADWFPGNRSFIQGQKEQHSLGRTCCKNTTTSE